MTFTQSGYPVIPDYGDPRLAKTSPVNAAPGVLDELVPIFEWVMAQFDRTVTPLIPSQCWGYAPRQIRGGSGWSNHASGSAIDLNATAFPQGQRRMTVAQIAGCHAIVAASHGAIRWGGDYGGSTAVDQQHFEITSVMAARAFAKTLAGIKPTAQEDDVTPQDIEAIADKVVDKIMSYPVTFTDAAQGPRGSQQTYPLGKGANNFFARVGRLASLTQDWVRKGAHPKEDAK